MRTLGIFAKTFRRNELGQVFEAIKQNGFTAIQFNMACIGLLPMPDHIEKSLLYEVRETINSSSLQLVGLSATFNMCHPNPVRRKEGLARLEVLAEASSVLHNSLLTLCTGTRNPNDKWAFHPDNASRSAWLDMCKSMEKAIEIAEQYDIYLGIEPELANVVANPAKAKQLWQEMQSDRLRIVLDPANLFEIATPAEIKYRIAEAIDLLAPMISMAHAKDRSANGEFVAPGKGIVPFRYFLYQLDQAGVDCPLVAHGFSEEEAASVALFLKNV